MKIARLKYELEGFHENSASPVLIKSEGSESEIFDTNRNQKFLGTLLNHNV